MSYAENQPQQPGRDARIPFHALLERLEAYSQKPDFLFQRELAMSRFLQPYLAKGQGSALDPLPAEIELAKLYLFSDYIPNDGHPSLVEQIRDEISDHIPEEERVWLDPIRHSFMDLLEISALGSGGAAHDVRLTSLGDGMEYGITSEDLVRAYKPGQILLTRLIRRPEYTLFPGIAVGLSQKRGRQVYDYVRDLQQEMEAETGAFELGDWQTFTKRYGHVLIWALAQLRLQWLLDVEDQVQFRKADHSPFLFCIGIYEHHEPKFINETIKDSGEWAPEPLDRSLHTEAFRNRPSEMAPLTVWVKMSDRPREQEPKLISRLTITPTQIFAEADSLDHFNDLKHFLASSFGFSIHFKGETTEPPFHTLPAFDLLSDDLPPIDALVSHEEEHERLAQLLESVYLDWAEHPCPALHQQTPRHLARDPDGKAKVATLIDELECNDLALLKTGKRGFDYNTLRAHVGIEEKP